MNRITDYLTNDHHRCDDLFAAAEIAGSAEDWRQAAARLADFGALLEHHFAMEEQVLFPAFEEETGMTQGPTAVMRSEHRQIRELMECLTQALTEHDREAFLGYADTLNTMIQQHNMKEEGILYRMSDRVLQARQSELIEAMEGVGR